MVVNEHCINKLPFLFPLGMEMDADQAKRRGKKKDYTKKKKKRRIIGILRDICPFICQQEKKVEKQTTELSGTISVST